MRLPDSAERNLVWRGRHTLFRYDGRDKGIRRNVKCRRVNLRPFGCNPLPSTNYQFIRIALFQRNRFSVEEFEINTRRGRRYIEWNLMIPGENGEPIRSDFVGNVTVRRDPVSTHDDG